MEKKTLEVLVVEDDAKHLADAKEVFQPLVAAGKATFDFATTYVEAKEKMGQKKYDGIISDIFFPYDAKGWDAGMAQKCAELFESTYSEMYVGNCAPSEKSDWKNVEAYASWKKGNGMHPTGVVVMQEALDEKCPIVLCTDTDHHGPATEPVNKLAKVKKVKLWDCYNGLGNKPWADAYKSLVSEYTKAEPTAPKKDTFGNFNDYFAAVDQFEAKYLP